MYLLASYWYSSIVAIIYMQSSMKETQLSFVYNYIYYELV